MRLATIRLDGATAAVRVDGPTAVVLPFPTVREVLESSDDWQRRVAGMEGRTLDAASLDFAPLIPNPEKTICVGLNYRAHAMEAGHDLPRYPILFAKYSRSLIGANDPIVVPVSSDKVDWEVELGVVIGRKTRDVPVDKALDAIAGCTILNDISMRDWQFRTPQYLQGKTFESSTPVGPYLVTPDELGDCGQLDLSCHVNGSEMQSSNTRDLIFSVADVISYISSIITLVPGDLIATGTPSGVGVARKPPVFLQPGSEVRCVVQGLGEQRNTCVARQAAARQPAAA